MDFCLSSEQEMMRESARRFVANRLDFAGRSNHQQDDGSTWVEMAELGWLMLPVSEERGGLGGGAEGAAIIAEELGRGLASEPFIEAAVLPARLLELGDLNNGHEALLAQLTSGEARFAVALYEPGRGFSLVPESMQASLHENGYSLSGKKVLVWGGDQAEWMIVSAQLDDGNALFIVGTHAKGVKRRTYQSIDGRFLADVQLDNVIVGLEGRLGSDGNAVSVIEEAVDEAIIALCADILGCIDRAIELTAEYLKVRQQFGQPLANFQALQHGIANLFIEANDARSILYRGMSSLGGPVTARRRAVSASKLKIMEVGRSVTGAAVHFHGGIGTTTEYQIGHHLQRVLVAEQMFGNGAYHFERFLVEGG
jgi:acyl-CoA dehydrogenase